MEVDASNYATGGVLSQQQTDGTWRPVDFISKSFSPAQMNYATYDKEFLTVVRGLEEWRQYLLGSKEPFEIHTDHANLQYFQKEQHLNPRQTRWHSILQNFSYVIKYKPGRSNMKADTLSRQPDLLEGKRENPATQIFPSNHLAALVIPEPTMLQKLQHAHSSSKPPSNLNWTKNNNELYEHEGKIWVPPALVHKV